MRRAKLAESFFRPARDLLTEPGLLRPDLDVVIAAGGHACVYRRAKVSGSADLHAAMIPPGDGRVMAVAVCEQTATWDVRALPVGRWGECIDTLAAFLPELAPPVLECDDIEPLMIVVDGTTAEPFAAEYDRAKFVADLFRIDPTSEALGGVADLCDLPIPRDARRVVILPAEGVLIPLFATYRAEGRPDGWRLSCCDDAPTRAERLRSCGSN